MTSAAGANRDIRHVAYLDVPPRVQTGPPVRAFIFASVGGGGLVNAVLLGRTKSPCHYHRLKLKRWCS